MTRLGARHRSFAAIVALTFAGQLCGLAYEVTVAARFGTGVDADALAFALMLVMAGTNELGTWIGTVFVPMYIERRSRPSGDVATVFFRRALVAVVALGGGLAVSLALGAGGVVALLGGALPTAESVGLLRLFTPLLILVPVAALLAATLQAHDRFAAAGSRQVWWYGTTLVALFVLARRWGPATVPLGMTLGFLLYALVLALRVRRVVPVSPVDGGTGGGELRPLVLAVIPLALASALNYVNVSIERRLAAGLPEGSLSSLTYAFRLLNFPVNLVILNATAMLLPALSRRAAAGDTAALGTLLTRAARLTILFTALLAALGMALAEPAIRLLLERGAFGRHSTALTATAVVWYAPGIVGMAAAQVLSRGYQARMDITRMVGLSVVVILLNIGLMPLLTATIGFRGLPLAASLTALVWFALALGGLGRRVPDLDVGLVVASAARATAAGLVTIAAALGARVVAGDSPLAQVLAGAAAGLIAYAAALLAFGRSDLGVAVEVVAPALARRFAARTV